MLAQRLLAVKQQESGPVPTTGSLFGIISDLGLTSGLKLCLDAGDAASYDPAVQTAKWLDTSGNGTDFFRGTTASVQSMDPTFNGVGGGLSSAEFWSSDGSDYFGYDTSMETWMHDLYKENAVWSCIAVAKPTSVSASKVIFASGATSRIRFNIQQPGGNLRIFGYNGGATSIACDAAAAVNVNAWNVVGACVDDTSDSCRVFTNGVNEEFAVGYTSPPTTNAGGASFLVGKDTGTSTYMPENFACIAVWQGVALTSAQLTDIYNAIKGRFGL